MPTFCPTISGATSCSCSKYPSAFGNFHIPSVGSAISSYKTSRTRHGFSLLIRGLVLASHLSLARISESDVSASFGKCIFQRSNACIATRSAAMMLGTSAAGIKLESSLRSSISLRMDSIWDFAFINQGVKSSITAASRAPFAARDQRHLVLHLPAIRIRR